MDKFFYFNFILPFFILFSAMVDDLRSRKIHNTLILILLSIVIVSVVVFHGIPDSSWFLSTLLTIVVALLITVPLVLLKVIGGGDMKLCVILAFILPFDMLIETFKYAAIWGAILGVVKIILDKKIVIFYKNILQIFKFKKLTQQSLHSFPFSVSLLVGWLSAFYF